MSVFGSSPSDPMSEEGRSRGRFLGVAAQLERAGDNLAGQTLGVAAHARSAEASPGEGAAVRMIPAIRRRHDWRRHRLRAGSATPRRRPVR